MSKLCHISMVAVALFLVAESARAQDDWAGVWSTKSNNTNRTLTLTAVGGNRRRIEMLAKKTDGAKDHESVATNVSLTGGQMKYVPTYLNAPSKGASHEELSVHLAKDGEQIKYTAVTGTGKAKKTNVYHYALVAAAKEAAKVEPKVEPKAEPKDEPKAEPKTAATGSGSNGFVEVSKTKSGNSSASNSVLSP